jgi:outer membrane biosynthesis protein TonB
MIGLQMTMQACGGSTTVDKPPVTAAQLGEPDDEIDPKVIGAAVRGNSREFQLCYESARQRNPSLAGQVDIRFVIRRDGSVGPSAVAESSLPREVSDCIARTFLRLTLPQQERTIVAQYPMFLDPN